MLVTCTEQSPSWPETGSLPGCGKAYDDAKRWTICPHRQLDKNCYAKEDIAKLVVACPHCGKHDAVLCGSHKRMWEAIAREDGVVHVILRAVADAYEHKPPATVTVRMPACGKSGPWSQTTGAVCDLPKDHGGMCCARVLIEGDKMVVDATRQRHGVCKHGIDWALSECVDCAAGAEVKTEDKCPNVSDERLAEIVSVPFGDYSAMRSATTKESVRIAQELIVRRAEGK